MYRQICLKFYARNRSEGNPATFTTGLSDDMSGIDAVNKLTEPYTKAGKKLHLRHLSEDCRRLLSKASSIIEVNIMDDPDYRVATE